MAKQQHPDDDLFSSSTMSIGDHLEELRVALFRSVLGLMVGFGLGLTVASWVVEWIKSPLEASLEKFYIDKSISILAADLGDKSLEESSNPLNQFMHSHRVVFEKQFVEVREIARLQKLYEEQLKDDVKPDAESEDEEKPPRAVADGDTPDVRLASTEPPAEEVAEEKPQIGADVRIVGLDMPAPGGAMIAVRAWKPITTLVKALNSTEVFMIWMKAGLVVGVVISCPYIFWQIWNFVAAGLYPHEKRYVYIYLPFSIGLFLAGAGLCFYFVIPQVLDWLLGFNRALNIDPDPRINEWIGFVLFLPLGFGISFQLPLVMLLLNRIGILSVEIYLAKWRIAVLVIFIISMVLTPADPVSMLFMAIPLTFLYFGGIGLCQWMPRGRNPFDAAYEP
jgi:sec-independent protein translocase protein TatC